MARGTEAWATTCWDFWNACVSIQDPRFDNPVAGTVWRRHFHHRQSVLRHHLQAQGILRLRCRQQGPHRSTHADALGGKTIFRQSVLEFRELLVVRTEIVEASD